MVDVLTQIGFAAGSVLLAIVCSGFVSGLVSFGLVERFMRSGIQRRVLDEFLTDESEKIEHVFSTEEIREIERAGKSRAFSYLLGIPRELLFGMPNQQFCGQITSGINNEVLHADGSPERMRLLNWIVVSFLQRETRLDGFARSERRLHSHFGSDDIDTAMRGVDFIQIKIAKEIEARAFLVSLISWIVIFGAIGFSLFERFKFSTDESWWITNIAGSLIATVAVSFLTIVFSFCTAVVATVTFGFLDRFAARQ